MTRPRLLLAALALVLAAPLAADTVELRNGDRLSGDIVTATGGVLQLDPPWGDPLAIPFAEVARIVTDAAVTVETTAGERFVGALTTGDDEVLRVAVADGPPVEIPFAEVAALDPPEPSGFHGSLSLGATAQRGNTRRTTYAVAGEAVHEDEEDRFTLRLRWVDAREDRVTTSKSTFGSFQYDYFVADRWYLLAAAEILQDELRGLDLRTVAGLGAGWQAIESETLDLDLEAGLSYVSRDFVADPDEEVLSARLAADLGWKLFGRLTLGDSLVLYPSLEDDEIVLRNDLSLETDLFAGWGIQVANVLDYDSDPPAGREAEDLLWIVSLLYSFD